MDRCDILILTAGFGFGHTSAAMAIQEHLQARQPSLIIKIIDLFQATCPISSRYFYQAYDLLVKWAPNLYNRLYFSKQSGRDVMTWNSLTRWFVRHLNEIIQDCNPGIVISTFPLCSYYLSRIKETLQADIKLTTCITDFVPTFEWIQPGTDLYLLAAPELKALMIQQGIPEDNLEVTGIPIKKAFLSKQDGIQLPVIHEIAQEDFVVLFMGGGTGQVPSDISFYNQFNKFERLKLLILTGNNIKLYNSLSKCNTGDNLIILEFTEDVAALMNRADLLVSKAGGITISEAISSNLPFILYKPVLGQELENCKFVETKGLGKIIDNEQGLLAEIEQLLNDEDYYYLARKRISQYSRQIDPSNLVSRILQLFLSSSCSDWY